MYATLAAFEAPPRLSRLVSMLAIVGVLKEEQAHAFPGAIIPILCAKRYDTVLRFALCDTISDDVMYLCTAVSVRKGCWYCRVVKIVLW